jgi:ABC-2 type transport system ATP-binding protein
VIRTIGLTKHFGSLEAVRDLSLTIESGELFGFLGPNGAGKTTTVRMLVGLLQPTAGTAIVAGHDVLEEPLEVKRSVGYLAEVPYLYEKLTGAEFLRFVGGLYGLSDSESDERAERLLDLFDLAEKRDQLVQGYSRGMRQKLGLSAALLHEPQVLLLDEPLAGFDPRSAARAKEVLRGLCSRGVAVMMCTHVLEIAERVCDRIGILDEGRLIAVGTMEELRRQAHSAAGATLEELFLRLTGDAETAEVAAVLGGGGVGA